MPAVVHQRATRGRKPLATTVATTSEQPLPSLVDIFNNSQHVTSSEMALGQLKKVYKSMTYSEFEKAFREYVKKLFQSKQGVYFKTSCEFLCKFLQYLSKLSDDLKENQNDILSSENEAPTRRSNRRLSDKSFSSTVSKPPPPKKRGRQPKKANKRKASASSEDELVAGFLEPTADSSSDVDSDSMDELVSQATVKSTRATKQRKTVALKVNDHDRIVSACIDVADMYMQVADEGCRFNAIFFICKFLSHVESLDEEICEALKATLPKRIRDKRPVIRAQAVLASRSFQCSKLTQDGFRHHFERDPELVVRKALLQIMDTKVFGFDFIVDSTQDFHEIMRRAAFQRLGKISPTQLTTEQLHQVIRNGLNERDRQASYAFKVHTMEPWLHTLYDGLDLLQLVGFMNVLDNAPDVSRFLDVIFERDLEKVIKNGTTTQLHHVVENFRDTWMTKDGLCLPNTFLDEKVTVVWLSLVKFCKRNHSIIKPIVIRPVEAQEEDHNESIEKILDSQTNNDEVVELYDRLSPDLVNLIDYLKKFVEYSTQDLMSCDIVTKKLEFIFHELIELICTYEIGDELERKKVQETLGSLLKENVLVGKFQNYIPPILGCLYKLVYSNSSNIMINYISEMINNTRSHLEDLLSTTQLKNLRSPTKTPRSLKKARYQPDRRSSRRLDLDEQNIEFKIATLRVEIEELKDKFEECIKQKNFDAAKEIDIKLDRLKSELNLLHDRRCSLASDVSHMSMIIDNEPVDECKLSSTMIGDVSMTDSQNTVVHKEDCRIFRHHTNELLKCLQMYFGCLQNVQLTSVPPTMLNHLNFLSFESLDDWFKDNSRVRSLMVSCNGLTALVDKEFASQPSTIALLMTACLSKDSIEVRTAGFKSIVDMLCHHENLEVPIDKLESFLNIHLREYGKYNPKDIKMNELDFLTALVEGACKLIYCKKLDSPQVLSHLIIWWYHPRTQSRLKQFIGVYLPILVVDLAKQQRLSAEDDWLTQLLEETFVTSVEFLHEYILGPGFNIMAATDIQNLINFLCNLIPVSFHAGILAKVEERMESLPDGREDLLKYLKQSKNCLAATAHIVRPEPQLPEPQVQE